MTGGFALAASWVWGKDHHIHSFVEIEPFCQKVLKKHWPETPIHDNIRTYKHDGTTIDLITAGYPCQGESKAGKRRGKKDDRWLWPETIQQIREISPAWFIGENVDGHVSMGLDQVLTDLEGEGYSWRTFIIPACAKDAPHRRDRVWIVAHSGCQYGTRPTIRRESKGQVFSQENASLSERPTSNDREGDDSNSNQFNGNNGGFCSSEVSQQQKTCLQRLSSPDTANSRIKSRREWENSVFQDTVTSNTSGSRSTVRISGQDNREKGNTGIINNSSPEPNRWQENWYEVATRLCGVDARVPNTLHETIRDYGYADANYQEAISAIDIIRREILREMWSKQCKIKSASSGQKSQCGDSFMHEVSYQRTYDKWKLGERIKTEPDLRNMWERICSARFSQTQDLQQNMLERIREIERNEKVASQRVNRLKSLGNAIVPQVVVPIMEAIKEIEIAKTIEQGKLFSPQE